jgi:tight adherence protein C
MTALGVGMMVFCLMSAAAISIYVGLYGSRRAYQERFEEMAFKLRANQANVFVPDTVPQNFTRLVLRWATARMPRPKSSTPAAEKTSAILTRAGFMGSEDVRTFHAVRILTTIAGATVGFAAGLFWGHGGRVMVAAIAGAVIGLYAPLYYLKRRAANRQRMIARELSDVLDLLVVCVDAGLGLFEAVKVVGDETERHRQAIGAELSIVAGEAAAGLSLGQALRNLAQRTAVEDLRPLAATLIQSEQLGAQIGPTLRASSDAMRTRRRIKAEEAAQKSTVKILFPLVLFILPAMLLVIIAPAIIQAMRTLR